MASKQDEYQKVKKSLQTAEDRLSVIRKRLPELNKEMEGLLVLNEVKGRKQRAIKRIQNDSEELRKAESLLEAKISALKKSLPAMEKQARIEVAKKETGKLYEKAQSELTEMAKVIPSLDVINNEIGKIKHYSEALEEVKSRYLSLSKEIADVLAGEKLDGIGGLTLDTLRSDRNELDCSKVLQFSDSLIDLSENINRLQYELFRVATNNPLEYYLPPEPAPQPEISPCGRFKIAFEDAHYNGYLKETYSFEGKPIDNWKRIRSTGNKITFEELKQIADNMRQKEIERLQGNTQITGPSLQIY